MATGNQLLIFILMNRIEYKLKFDNMIKVDQYRFLFGGMIPETNKVKKRENGLKIVGALFRRS